MRNTVRAAPIVLSVALLLLGSDAFAGGDPASAGAATFAGKCASCHAKDGSGSSPMGKKLGLRNLGAAEVQKQTDKQLYDITAKGRKKMPAYEKKLTAQQIKDLVEFMRTLAKK